MSNLKTQLKPKFKVGQAVSYPLSHNHTHRSRKEGKILKIEKMYELKEKYKRPNAGELTTIKKLSKGIFKGYAYLTKSIQPAGYTSDYTTFIENNLRIIR